jgi:hypothetical protein
LQELGGLNLYGFADNDGINKGDSDGRKLIEGEKGNRGQIEVSQ